MMSTTQIEIKISFLKTESRLLVLFQSFKKLIDYIIELSFSQLFEVENTSLADKMTRPFLNLSVSYSKLILTH